MSSFGAPYIQFQNLWISVEPNSLSVEYLILTSASDIA